MIGPLCGCGAVVVLFNLRVSRVPLLVPLSLSSFLFRTRTGESHGTRAPSPSKHKTQAQLNSSRGGSESDVVQ